MKLKIGNRVAWYGDQSFTRKGTVKNISNISKFPYLILWDDGSRGWYSESFIVLMDDDKIMDVEELFKEIEI